MTRLKFVSADISRDQVLEVVGHCLVEELAFHTSKAKPKWDVALPTREGNTRQVDVALRYEEAGEPILRIVEVEPWSRPMGAEAVDELIGIAVDAELGVRSQGSRHLCRRPATLSIKRPAILSPARVPIAAPRMVRSWSPHDVPGWLRRRRLLGVEQRRKLGRSGGTCWHAEIAGAELSGVR